ncbi:tail tape measure protein [Sphingomonas immobilis]|uniref:Tail tape measure protein n=1 Tax=Sphingomonas immobilis TaxID=3063997 RepID=A0ABT9A1P3_9SPHN|nr:tail tape measure protein [Sphingomonas sp. CA1-15]MDO7843749.1 tail tape measure protein [Sphingomonas sp. CA1-15]
MDEEIERLVISVRADTAGFARDVADMRASLDGPLAAGADRAGAAIENALVRAAKTGSLGFEDLRKVALSVLGDIASAAIRGGIDAILGGGGGSGGGLLSALGGLFGAPGRATGGPVSPMRPYWVGERGPELFVPTASGSVMAAGGSGGAREVRVAITVNAASGEGGAALAASSRQVARAVKAALGQG